MTGGGRGDDGDDDDEVQGCLTKDGRGRLSFVKMGANTVILYSRALINLCMLISTFIE